MKVRPEATADYAAIAQTHALAFDERADEAALVANLRQQRQYDPELSLVAEIDGQIAGHALFMPYRLRLSGQTIEAVNLAPLGVHPAYQRQGVGTALLEAGHQIAKAKGYAFSFLLGHVAYYPRFGYQTRAFGVSSVAVSTADVSGSQFLASRRLTASDIPVLHSLWEHEEGAVDFALEPGHDLLDWLALNSHHSAQVYLRDGVLVGYTRRSLTEIQHFMAVDHEAARAMALSLAGDSETITLPLHPRSASAGAFASQPQTQAWQAAMVLPLRSSPFADYHAAVQAGTRPPGYPIWPPAFDL
jgi:predicted N-acetyltransferase YhbS